MDRDTSSSSWTEGGEQRPQQSAAPLLRLSLLLCAQQEACVRVCTSSGGEGGGGHRGWLPFRSGHRAPRVDIDCSQDTCSLVIDGRRGAAAATGDGAGERVRHKSLRLLPASQP